MNAEIEPVLDATLSAPPPPRLGRKSWVSRIFGHRAVIMLVINVGFILIMTRLSPYFLYAGNGYANFKVMLVSMAMDSIVLAAMVMLLIGGMFDLSVDGVVNMTGVVTGALLVSGVSVWVAVAAGAASALVVGLIDGISVTWLRMNPLMTTLGTWWVAQGLAFGITQGISSHSFPSAFIDIGYSAPMGVTMPIWYACILVALAIWVLAKTRFGYHVYAIGGNREGARLHGVKVNRVTIISFVLVALAGALSGIVYAARLNAAVPQTVNGLNLQSHLGCRDRRLQPERRRGVDRGSASRAIFHDYADERQHHAQYFPLLADVHSWRRCAGRRRSGRVCQAEDTRRLRIGCCNAVTPD